jgi:5S rRNA maturation endonuclease (ribonuclease M5)
MKHIYDFNDVKRHVSCRQYLESRGIDLNSASRCVAVWRGGKNRNVHVYDNDGVELWKDFKTDESGSVIDLAMKIEGFTDIQNAANALGERFGVPPKATKRKPAPLVTRAQMLIGKGYRLDATYDYTDEDGKPVYHVDRYMWKNPFCPPPEDFKVKEFVQRTPTHEGLDSDTPQLLYRLPEVVAAGEVFIVEGEKDVETLREWGFTATTNSGGASKDGSKKWPIEMNRHFIGKNVVVIADNDDKGQAHAKNLHDMLTPIAASLRVLTISSLPKGDVTDWKEKEGGSAEKLREAVAALPVPVRKDVAVEEEQSALAKAKMLNAFPLCNYITESRQLANGRQKSVDVARTINDLVDDVHARFLGFPMRIGDYALFDHDRDSGRIETIDRPDALFAWIGQKSKQLVNWKRIDGAVSKGELFSGLIRSAPRFEKVAKVPDFPMRKDVYYTFRNRMVPTPDHKAFRTLLSFFSIEDDGFSPAMLSVLFAAPLYFRNGVQRPCWIVDTHAAQAVGKTTLVKMVAKLYGCTPLSITKRDLEYNSQEIIKRIVSISGRDTRIALLDNLKGFFDDPQWAEFVTASSFSGRAPYGHGEETRPNDMTFVITANSAQIGSDTESRSFFLYVNKHQEKARWETTVLDYIESCRFEIFGDIIDILGSAPDTSSLRTYTRVSDFERDVVFPLCGCDVTRFDSVMQNMVTSRQGANTDTERARDIVDDVCDGIRKAVAGFNPDTGIAFVRTDAMEYWLKGRNLSSQDLWTWINTNKIECFHKTIKAFPRSKSHPLHRRGFLYIGPNAKWPEDHNIPILRLNNRDKAVVYAGSESSQKLLRELAAEGWFARATSVIDVECDCEAAPREASSAGQLEMDELDSLY